MCRHPILEGFNGYVLSSRSIFSSGESTNLTCNGSTRFDLIPMIDYITCDNHGNWKPVLPRCYGRFFPYLIMPLLLWRFSFFFLFLEKCRLSDLGKGLASYYRDDSIDQGSGKELQSGAYIRHGYSIKYLCQCQSKSSRNCSLMKLSLIKCIDGKWTTDGPHCRGGISTSFSSCLLLVLLCIRNVRELSNFI